MARAPVYKVAVIQLHPQPLKIESNHETACEYIRNAAWEGCHIAVLPEYHLTSWVPDDPKFSELCADYQKYLDSYCRLAKKCNICIVPGTIVERHEDQLLNVAYFISNDGTILSSYQKKNLWHPERPHLTSSTHEPHEAFDTPIGKVGMLICWDLAFPEAFRELIAAGAKIIIVPTFWMLSDCSEAGRAYNPMAEALFLNSTLVSRTFENTCAIIFANVGGPVGMSTGDYCGLSQVAVPFIGSLGKLASEENMSIVDLDMQILEEAEQNYKVREDIGTEGWHYKYSLTRDDGEEKL